MVAVVAFPRGVWHGRLRSSGGNCVSLQVVVPEICGTCDVSVPWRGRIGRCQTCPTVFLRYPPHVSEGWVYSGFVVMYTPHRPQPKGGKAGPCWWGCRAPVVAYPGSEVLMGDSD